MDAFCGDTFWNTTLLVDNTWPQMTSCFLDLVVTCLPCLVFWMTIPCYVYMTEANRIPQQHCLPSSLLCVAKLAGGCVLCALAVLRLIQHISTTWSSATLTGDSVLLVTLLMATSMTQYERTRCVMTSPAVFVFWFLKGACDIVPLYTMIILKDYETDMTDFAVFVLSFGLTLTMTVLYAFADPLAVAYVRKVTSAGEKACPETFASFLNQLTFAWLNKLMVTAFRRNIEETDLCTLTPRDQSSTLVPVFERLWAQEVESRVSKPQPHVSYSKGLIKRQSFPSSDERTPLLGEEARPPKNAKVMKDGGEALSEQKRCIIESYDSDSTPYDLQRTLYDSYRSEEEDVSFQSRPSSLRNAKSRPSLVRVLLRQFGKTMALAMVQRLVSDAMFIVSPLILGQLVNHLNNRHAGREWQGYVMAVALLLAGITRTVFYSCGVYHTYCVGLQIKSVIIGAVFNKALRISNEAKKRATSGEITSLMSVDAYRLQEFAARIYFGMTVPFVIIAILVVMFVYVQDAVFAGISVLAVLIPISVIAGVCQRKVQEKLLVFKDLRVKVLNEILNGMKVLKLYAWEESFERRVSEVRGQEVKCLWKMALLYIVLALCVNMMAFLMTLAIFGWYVTSETDHFLDASTAFVIMAMLNVLSPMLDSLGMTLAFFVQAAVSVRRINDFLCSEELELNAVTPNNNPGVAIQVKRTTVAWDDPRVHILRNIDLKVASGRLVAVVGQVGAGKSSLISCILGEMIKVQGDVSINGTVAYVAQQAWIQNATLRDNVLFGQPYQRDRYNAVIKACQLERDLSLLPAGDLTEIGEKGTNLSGGQKQRVSLARAVYSDCDVYLLDDPLSAVDSHVGKAIFSDVIGPRGILKGKTRVLVTHGVHWLPLVDEVVVMKQGQISEVGSYSQLVKHNGDFAQFLKVFFIQEHDVDEDFDQTDPEVMEMRRKIWVDVESATTDGGTSGDERLLYLLAINPQRKRRKDRGKRQQKSKHRPKTGQGGNPADMILEERGKLTSSETVERGRVPISVYLHYAKAAGFAPIVVTLLMCAVFRAANVVASFWLRQWTDDPLLKNQSTWGSEAFVYTNEYYLIFYGLLGLLQVVLLVAYSILHWKRTTEASRRLHDGMINRLFRAPMAFFDTTPMGRIMNKVSLDMEIVDNVMPIILRDVVSMILLVTSVPVVVMIVSPISSVFVLLLVVFGCTALAAYVPTSRQCKRMEAVSRSPIFAHFSETVSGAATIRAYRATERFIAESKMKVDANQVFYYTWLAGLRWVQMMLENGANMMIFMAAIFEIVSPDSSGAKVGLSVSYIMLLTGSLNYFVKTLTDFETNVVSVERIKEYAETESEAPWINEMRRPVGSWPCRGRVELREYQTRYRPGLELVLKGVSCDIRGGEKIGIVGRTGAGKSSLSLALFRLIEAAQGAILIDGVNIADIGLHDLRTRLTILPQDPVLFSGSLRFNMDPFEEHEDQALWKALQQAHLHDFVKGLPGTLSYECGEEGLNLSVGQRQLVCLARTLLRKTRILVLDEATAAVDMETDALIQSTVREAFSDCTILTVAHRLNTIMDYDRILVLDSGTICEFDTPQNLQARQDSVFYAMLKDAGLA